MKNKNELNQNDFPILVSVGNYPQDLLIFGSFKDIAGKNFEVISTCFSPEMFYLVKNIYEVAWQKGYNVAEQNRRWEKDELRFNGG